MNDMSQQKSRIDSIQILRGLACLFIVFCHTSATDFGQTGVDFFLVISGFVMMFSTEEGYWRKRIKKIIPLYWSMTILTSVMIVFFPQLFHSYEFSWEYFIKSLFFIPYYHGCLAGPIMALGWTLNYEMFFYVLFWIAIKISYRYRAAIMIAFSVCLILSGKLFSLPLIIEYWFNPIILEFSYGIIAYYLWKIILNSKYFLNTKEKNIVISVIAYTVFGIGITLMEIIIKLDWGGARAFNVGIIASFITLLFIVLNNIILMPKALIHLGNISYEIYLLHSFPVRTVDLILRRFIEPSIISSIICVICAVSSIEIIMRLWKKLYIVTKNRLIDHESKS